MTFAVSQRTRELAVRMAVGAQPGEVVAGTIGGGVRLALAGVAVGGAIAWWASRLLEQFVYDVNVTGPLTYAGVATMVALVGVAASWLPARRAARVDPVVVLNAE
jgi:ABC-type antimicrobial peptide transport system permease subunit